MNRLNFYAARLREIDGLNPTTAASVTRLSKEKRSILPRTRSDTRGWVIPRSGVADQDSQLSIQSSWRGKCYHVCTGTARHDWGLQKLQGCAVTGRLTCIQLS
jgi:hypothetical protein